MAKCHKCGIKERIELLDAKPGPNKNWEVLECVRCYGEGWMPLAVEHIELSVAPELKPWYEAWLEANT